MKIGYLQFGAMTFREIEDLGELDHDRKYLFEVILEGITAVAQSSQGNCLLFSQCESTIILKGNEFYQVDSRLNGRDHKHAGELLSLNSSLGATDHDNIIASFEAIRLHGEKKRSSLLIIREKNTDHNMSATIRLPRQAQRCTTVL